MSQMLLCLLYFLPPLISADEIVIPPRDPSSFSLDELQKRPHNAWVNPGRGWVQIECVKPRHDCGFDCCEPSQRCDKNGRCVTRFEPLPLPPPPGPPPIFPPRPGLPGRPRVVVPVPVPVPVPIPSPGIGPGPVPGPGPLPGPGFPDPYCSPPNRRCGRRCCSVNQECVGELYCVRPQRCRRPSIPCGSTCCAPWERCVAGVCGRLNSYCQYPRIQCESQCCEEWQTCDVIRKQCFNNPGQSGRPNPFRRFKSA